MAGTPRYPFFTHQDCEYFPCHKGLDPEQFNCAFCYCPLYALGDKCGGDFTYIADRVKDCSNCTLPHRGTAGIALVQKHYMELMELAMQNHQQ